MLLKPLITEKSLDLAKYKKYTFVVSKTDTKTVIKNLVEKTFKVNVLSTKTAIMHGKSYRAGRRGQIARKADWKKAIVQIKPDQTIDLFDSPSN